MSALKLYLKLLLPHHGALFGLIIILIFALMAIFAPLLAPHDPYTIYPDFLRIAPGLATTSKGLFLFGTDDVGRDLLSRLIYGARLSLLIGISVVAFSSIIGGVLGLVSGYKGGYWDTVIMRLMDILMAFPSVLLAIVIVSILGPGLLNTIIAVSIVAIPSFTRLIRAQAIAEKEKPYIHAALTFGAGPWRIMLKEILPNCGAPLIIQGTLGLSDAILNAAALGFLGLGAQAPLAEWGTMLADARAYIESSPSLVTLPGVCILLLVLGLNLLGDGLRDILDPKVGQKR